MTAVIPQGMRPGGQFQVDIPSDVNDDGHGRPFNTSLDYGAGSNGGNSENGYNSGIATVGIQEEKMPLPPPVAGAGGVGVASSNMSMNMSSLSSNPPPTAPKMEDYPIATATATAV